MVGWYTYDQLASVVIVMQTPRCGGTNEGEEQESKHRTTTVVHLSSESHVVLIPAVTPSTRNNLFFLATR